MSRILILVEGATEEQFIIHVLAPYFETQEKYLIPVVMATKRVPGLPHLKGGVSTYGKMKRNILHLCRDSNAICVTTMIDYYGIPHDFPGIETLPHGPAPEKVQHLETALARDISNTRFVPYLALHEFEALLFADPNSMCKLFARNDILDALYRIRSAFVSPEGINDTEPPSKRIEALIGAYDKPYFGALIALEIGLERIRAECPHFNDWLTTLEHLGLD